MRLSELPLFQSAVITDVRPLSEGVDKIANRLQELGFVPGESIKLIARGPIGADPLLIQIGYTRFALRRSEAQRVLVDLS